MQRELTEQLKQLKHGVVSPRPEWLKSNRELLLAQIKNTLPADNHKEPIHFGNFWNALSVLFPRQFVFSVVRPLSVLLIILSVVTSGWVSTVDAAYEAMPGDWLYPAKRAVEKTRVTVATVTGDKEAETELHSEFAKRRAQETKNIFASNDPDKTVKAAQSVSDLKTEIKAVNINLEEIKNDSSVSLSAAMVKNINQNTEQVKNVLQDVKNDLLVSSASIVSTTVSGTLTKELAEVKDLTKDTAVKAVEMVVSKHLDGNSTMSKDEVTQMVSNALETAVADVAMSKQDAVGINKVVSAVQAEVEVFTSESIVKNNPEAVSTTQQFSQQITAVANETRENVIKTEAATAVVDKKVTEANVLLSLGGDLNRVANKVKEVTEVAKVVEKINDQTLQSVQSVLPIVNIVKDDVVKASVSSTIVVVTTTPAIIPEKLPVRAVVSSTPEKK